MNFFLQPILQLLLCAQEPPCCRAAAFPHEAQPHLPPTPEQGTPRFTGPELRGSGTEAPGRRHHRIASRGPFPPNPEGRRQRVRGTSPTDGPAGPRAARTSAVAAQQGLRAPAALRRGVRKVNVDHHRPALGNILVTGPAPAPARPVPSRTSGWKERTWLTRILLWPL